MSREVEGCIPNKKRILPSWLINSKENEPKSPPSKRLRLTYDEKRDFLMSNKRVAVKRVFMRQRASLVEGETKISSPRKRKKKKEIV